MKKVCFFDLPFIRQDNNAKPEHNYRRILAGDKVFYTFVSQFSDKTVLKKLQDGDRVFIGARPLADGSYWLHWLVSPERGNLEPVTGPGNMRNLKKLALALVMVIFSSWLFFTQLTNVIAALVLMIVFGGGLWMLASSVQALLVTNSRTMKQFLNGLAQVKAGNTGICSQAEYLLPGTAESTRHRRTGDDGRFNELDSVRPEDYRYAEKLTLTGVQGPVTDLRSVRDFTGSGKSRRDYIEYYFLCNGIPFTLRNYYSSMTEDINPLFFRSHPFFIAGEDAVNLIVNQQKGVITGLYNERDHSAYLKPDGMAISSQQVKMMYKVFTGIFLVMMLMVMIFIFHDLWSIKGTPDKWDWLHAAKSLGGMALMFLMMISGILLLVEMVTLLVRKKSAGAARFVFVRQMLIQLRLRNGKNTVVQEIN
ncbi:hypothetical protein [Morganella morganii]|uniref:hypothetical protein n=1 Tax=Morganella morganii TaxID=582 RepID=UPI001BDAE337|nr:hypothetical protein [Morganella morganii]ELT0452354.1 hypothetical protein [Morganella morganii]MBT0335509.1 hypothetical protein [Morganella morganii subsp. morganii]